MRLHRVLAAALRRRTQIGSVTKHIRQRHQRVHLLCAGTGFLTQDLDVYKRQLLGLKENVIIGKLIPAGSGLGKYRSYAEKLVPDKVNTPEPLAPAVGMDLPNLFAEDDAAEGGQNSSAEISADEMDF